MKRHKVNKRMSQRMFAGSAASFGVHARNLREGVSRGGIRL